MPRHRTKSLIVMVFLGVVTGPMAMCPALAYAPNDFRVDASEGASKARSLRVAQATASVTYTYDAAGRIVTKVFSDGTCVIHTYSADGNRTATDITKSSTPETSVWGTGVWGCFPWSP
jgi:YD repeat-containing protein